jgi:hypothetical protein
MQRQAPQVVGQERDAVRAQCRHEPANVDRYQSVMKKNDGREVEQAAVDEESDIAAQGGSPQRHHLLHIKGQEHKKRSNVADTIHCAHGNPPELLRAWPTAEEDQARSVQGVKGHDCQTRSARASPRRATHEFVQFAILPRLRLFVAGCAGKSVVTYA